ncbi:MAG: hypothetical protein AB7L41_02865 [Flavobacteriaceae bacterium]
MSSETFRGPDETLARAFSYPYRLIGGPTLLAGAAELAVSAIAAAEAASGLALSVTAAGERFDLGERLLMLAAGSNASPEQLRRKFGAPAEPILLFEEEIAGLVSVHSAHVAGYGSVPATLMAEEGAVSRLTVLALTRAQLAHLDATEALGVNYRLVSLGARRLGGLSGIEAGLLAYRSLRGVFAPDGVALRLNMFRCRDTRIAAVTQRRALALAARISGFGGGIEGFVGAVAGDAAYRESVKAAMNKFTLADGLGNPPVLA